MPKSVKQFSSNFNAAGNRLHDVGLGTIVRWFSANIRSTIRPDIGFGHLGPFIVPRQAVFPYSTVSLKCHEL